MSDLGRQFEIIFNDIKSSLLGIWDKFYSSLVNAMGEGTANLFLIAGGALLIIFALLKFINRD